MTLIAELHIRSVVKGKDPFRNRCLIGTEKSVAPQGPAHYAAHVKTTSKSALGRRGRPAGVATKRINARFPTGLAEKIEYAASLRGVAVSAFIQEAVAERADRIIEAESHWQMTREESANLAAMIAKPTKPNQTMLNAVKLAARHVVIRS